jgi:formate hydrogenlyase transcriptional activator
VQAESLLTLAATAAAEHNFQNVLDTVVEGLAQQPGVAHARIWLLNPGDICQDCFFNQVCEDRSQCLHSVAAAGNTIHLDLANLFEQFRRVPLANRILGQVAQKGVSLLRNDAQEAVAGLARADWFKQEGIKAFAAHPLVFRGQTLGVLLVSSRESVSEQEFAWLRMFADQAAVAITNAQAFEQAESALRELQKSETKYRSLLELSPVAIYLVDPTGQFISANQAGLELLGCTAFELQDMPIGATYSPDELARIKTPIEAMGAGLTRFERAFLRRDGVTLTVEVSLSPMLPGGRQVVVRDITDRKRAEDALKEQARQLQQVIDVAPVHMFIWEADANVSYGNRASLQFFGPIPPKAPMEFLDQVTYPDDAGALKKGIKEAFASQEAFEMEVRMRRQDGEYRWFRYQLNPLRNEHGQIMRWCGTRIDIDEQKRAVAQAQKEYLELREHFDELQQIMDVVPLHLYLVQPDGTAIQSNRAVQEFWGPLGTLGPKEFLNQFAHPDDIEKLWAGFQKAAQTGQEFQMEARLRGLTGDYRWFLEHMTPIRDANGRVLRWCGTHIDIDDQKRAEERTQRENLVLREEIDKASMFEEIVGTSPALQSVLVRVAKVAPSDTTVLINGETGTGKELIARAIHKRSQRASRPFVSVNCAAIPRDLIASELFGHEKGAFTGALQRRLGRFELAEGGTIFLDEIGELNAETQVALLRVLQEREFDRVGGTRPIRADVRVITATHRDLPAEVAAGTFRSDLYYRINVFPVNVPALRERRDDIRLLVEYFIDRYATKAGKRITRIEKKSLAYLQSYAWPGNIRELQNVIERSVILCDSDEFSVDESWLTLKPAAVQPLREDLVDQEKKRIEAALAEAGGRVSGPSGAAAKLGIPASTLDSKIKSLHIDKRRFQSH